MADGFASAILHGRAGHLSNRTSCGGKDDRQRDKNGKDIAQCEYSACWLDHITQVWTVRQLKPNHDYGITSGSAFRNCSPIDGSPPAVLNSARAERAVRTHEGLP